MAATESQMLPLGTEAPEFSLPDPEGVLHGLANQAPAHLVMFICNHCPFVVHVQDELARLGRDYVAHGVDVIAISSNDVATHPQDGPEFMARFAAANGFSFPYLYDESQEVAKAYRAGRDKIAGTDLYFDLDLLADPDDPRDLFGMLQRSVG